MLSSTGGGGVSTQTIQQAEAVAEALKSELRFAIPPAAGWARKWQEKLCDSAEDLSKAREFTEQSSGHPDIKATPKTALGPHIADDAKIEDCKSLFCVAHLGFVIPSGIDIEHSITSREISKNQERFIRFLNDPANQAFSDAFLKVQGMADFFKTDPVDQKIKGTVYFYKICYNSIDNLWLICHGCNDKKGTKDERQWFLEQKLFGQAFITHLDNEGGIRSGVILRMVSGRQPMATLTMGQEVINIHQGTGLGKFARDWFLNQHQQEFEVHRGYYVKNYAVVKDRLERIRELRLKGEHKKAKKSLKALDKKIKRANAVLENASPSVSPRGSNSSLSGTHSSQENALVEEVKKVLNEASGKKRDLKKLCQYLRKKYPSETAVITLFFGIMIKKAISVEVSGSDVKKLRIDIVSQFGLNQSSLPAWSVIEEKIQNTMHSSSEKLELSEQQRKATERK